MHSNSKVKEQPHEAPSLAYDFSPLLASIEQENCKIDAYKPNSAPNSLRTPLEIRREQIKFGTKKLGAGQFGSVVMADYDPKGGVVPHEVAVKTLKLDDSTPSDKQDQLFREAAISFQFEHPNVVACIGVMSIGSPSAMIMQYCGRGSLEDVLKNEIKPSVDRNGFQGKDRLQFCQYAIDIARGMEHVHEKFFVHRDLAVRNVLVNSANRCQVSVST